MLCAKIGDCPQKQLMEAGIRATEAFGYDYIETAISALYAAEYGLDLSKATA